MKINLIFAFLSLFFLGCGKPVKKETTKPLKEVIQLLEVPTNIIDKSILDYRKNNSLWTLNGKVFSGYAVSYFPNSTLKSKFGILNGRKQNEATDWYPNGQIKQLAFYHKGKLHGEKKNWSADAQYHLISHLNYYLGKAHGQQKKWYPTGEIFKVLHLEMGKEEGIQQAFRKNGKLFANYEARNGRIFGLKRAALCYDLEEEVVISKK